MNANYINNTYSRLRSQSLTEVDNCDNNDIAPPPPRRDFGVMCGVLTRNIGVGHQNPNTKSVSTITPIYDDNRSDRWLDEKYRFLNGNYHEKTKPVTHTKSSQTMFAKETRQINTQTPRVKPKEFVEIGVQTFEVKKLYQHKGVNAQPNNVSKFAEAKVDMASIGVSSDTINDEYCSKCSILQKNAETALENNDLQNAFSVSLASLSHRSKSFNLGEDRLNFNFAKNRTVGCQYESNTVHKGCQYECSSVSKSCQHEIKLSTKASQSEVETTTKMTDTKGLGPIKKTVGCEANEVKEKKITFEVGCNTIIPTEKVEVCAKCAAKEKAEVLKKESKDEAPSRIPRLQMPTTPTENRKFKRQDTYTKIPALIPASPTA